MLVELIQVRKDLQGKYSLCPVFVNPAQIVYISENISMKRKLVEGQLGLGLNQNFTIFSDIRMNHSNYVSNITVVGDPGLIEQKIYTKKQKTLLKG